MSLPLFEVDELRIAVFDEATAVRNDDHGVVGRHGKPLGAGWVEAVPGVSLTVGEGEVLALVGESGSGKTLTLMGALGLLSSGAQTIGGEVRFRGRRMDLSATPEELGKKSTWRQRRRQRKRQKAYMGESLDKEWRHIMGTEIGILFQDPINSWHPSEVIGDQAGEVLAEHSDLSQEEIQERVLDALGEVKLPGVGSFLSFRHELSRGQAQRAMLASALLKAPSLLIADEPLSGLDASVARAILDLVRDMQATRGLGLIFVTHDLAVVASLADRVAVMYGGQIVEEGAVRDIFHTPTHPYTEGLLGSIPWPNVDRLRPISGQPPRIVDVDRSRCAFADRCSYRAAACLEEQPPLTSKGASQSACVRATELDLRGVGGRG